ncbi:phage tail domain-containing protein [Youngiibacter fragilis]|uniref:Tail protein n=1 Tax=Youngiibacter fragilis 232.1 TaxID=994573 RepID=V7I5S3_9CLOT|nr:phage tail domain-containing protein [Youngiibacter fragilis]ETA80636.1 hypothetical protein T472_0211285 [Youngiibacter fragilis 232.1]
MKRQTWQFNGVSLNTKAWSVIEVPEGIGTPGLRGSNLQVPFQNGKRWIKKRYDERIVMLPMWVRGLDSLTGKLPSGMSENEALYDNIDYLSGVFGKRGLHVLKRILPDGTVREALAEVYRPVSFGKTQAGHAKFAVEFVLSDPFFYASQTAQETQIITSTTQEWSHNNTGNAPVTDAIITLTGPMESPKIECLDSDVWLQYQGSIGAGESVVINTGDFKCTKGTTNMLSAIRHGGDAYWHVLEAGYNQLRLTNGVSGGSIKLEYYPAFF